VTLTHECNLRCSYCYGKCCNDFGGDDGSFGDIDYDLPDEISYPVSDLLAFTEKVPVENLIFYGGEPLLRVDRMREIMDTVPAARFMVQTNGLLLDRLRSDDLQRLHTLLVSIDGDEAVTDGYRGSGVYRRVLEQVQGALSRGFGGEVVARMTVGTATDLGSAVRHLLFDTGQLFDSVHWQLDAQFWRNDYDPKAFSRWVRSSYRPSLLSLLEEWISRMETDGTVLRIYPFLGVGESLLMGKTSGLRCGAGWAHLNVQTDGMLAACPAMAGMKRFYRGRLDSKEIDDVSLTEVVLNAPCDRCDMLPLCGGRCLYANATKLWGASGFRMVCETVRILINGLESMLPRIRRLIDDDVISPSAFSYTRFNSCEIIP
jgi:uncharacterized protein